MTRFNDAGRSGEDSPAPEVHDSSAGLFLRVSSSIGFRDLQTKGLTNNKGKSRLN